MVCRRRRKNPFLSWPGMLSIPCSPRIVPPFRAQSECPVNNLKEVLETQPTQVRSITAYHIPSLKCIRIVQVTTRHSGQSLKMLRKECLIDPKKEQKEMSLSMMLSILTPSQFPNPKIKSSKNSKDCSHTLNIMKMCDHVVSVVQCNIHSPICQNNSSLASKSKLDQKSQSKQHGSTLPNRSSVKSPEPTENFNSCGNCNNHSGTSKIPSSIYVQPYSVHVVSPNLEAQNRNGSHSIDHSYVSKNRFSREETLHVTDNSEPGKNQHVHFRVSKKPKQVLVLKHVSSSSRQKETSIEVTVSQLHGQSCSKNWQTSNQQNADKTHCPNEQRKSILSHSLCTHICNSDQKINRPLNTSDSCNMLAKNSLIYRSSGMAQCATQGWISCPSYSRTLLHLCTKLLKNQSHWQNPKRDII